MELRNKSVEYKWNTDARDNLSKVLKQEEDYWKQRAKSHWLKDGDSNTKYFHATASSARKKRNNIQKLMNHDGDMIQDQNGMCIIAKEYFDQLFKQGVHDDEVVTRLLHRRVTSEDNHSLTKDFVLEEFKEALFSMHSDKAPGPDGLNPAFYKRFWDLCVDNPTSMKDLRPISLCNVLYKVLSKVLANRLKPLLNRYIFVEQSAFFADRSILDNVMVAMETIHHMKCKVKGKIGEVALKIDISKVADVREVECMKKILNDYEKASGQAINYAKSEVYFSRNTPTNIKEQISNILGVNEVMGTGRYLGMSSMIGRNKKAIFDYLRDRMWKKIQSWSGKHLSKAGRELLVKVVAQAIPAYWKQGWHLLTNHDTILSRVFKAKYYPKEGFLEATLSHNPSYVWRSIHAFQVIVRRGLRWRLGNGNNINVWRQPWLRHSNQPYVTTTMIEGRKEMKVAELIINNSSTWNHELIQHILNDRDAHDTTRNLTYSYGKILLLKVQNPWCEIAKIPLNLTQQEDAPMWRFSKSGTYSVRFAYYQVMKNIIDNNHLKENGNRKKLWQLQVPNKMMDELNGNDFSYMVMIMWTLWWRRNQKCWDEKSPTIYEVIRRARDALCDWKKVQQQITHSNSSNTVVASHSWTKPPAGALKCNVDTTCYTNQNLYGVGACIRDAQGRLVQAFVKRFNGKPEIAEAVELLEAMKWIQNSHMPMVHVKTDCLQVVHGIRSNSKNNTEFGNIIDMCRNLINLNQNCKVSYVRRQANRVAYELAQASRFMASPQVFHYCPPCIEITIMNEMH
ncbi:hypothetical protein TSUD_226660 [Trifolium subterraneum]|uniref:RNase H type-1 domain-containing protein n=1 Tax=Trifolium subterraneum TaxID=3900 RepID=A0A2Z6N029_TRISU|nr:hypothetical protein TSUD_226660 [Trifolium subterraneum]